MAEDAAQQQPVNYLQQKYNKVKQRLKYNGQRHHELQILFLLAVNWRPLCFMCFIVIVSFCICVFWLFMCFLVFVVCLFVFMVFMCFSGKDKGGPSRGGFLNNRLCS